MAAIVNAKAAAKRYQELRAAVAAAEVIEAEAKERFEFGATAGTLSLYEEATAAVNSAIRAESQFLAAVELLAGHEIMCQVMMSR